MLQRRKYPEAKIYKQDFLFKNNSLNTPKSIAVVLHAELRKLNIASLLKFLKLLKRKNNNHNNRNRARIFAYLTSASVLPNPIEHVRWYLGSITSRC